MSMRITATEFDTIRTLYNTERLVPGAKTRARLETIVAAFKADQLTVEAADDAHPVEQADALYVVVTCARALLKRTHATIWVDEWVSLDDMAQQA